MERQVTGERVLCALEDIPDGNAKGFPAAPGGFMGLFAVRRGRQCRRPGRADGGMTSELFRSPLFGGMMAPGPATT